MSETFSFKFLKEVCDIANKLSYEKIEDIAKGLSEVKAKKGRLFFLGIGGSAANASHAVNDFRKICGIESYAPTDNISELTARTNDDGFESIFVDWLKCSRLKKEDAIFIFSVGGGNVEKNISVNLVKAIDYAKEIGAKIFGIVGRDGGYTAKSSNTVLIIPTVNKEHTTPLTESYQAIIWHLLVTHPAIRENQTKWETVK
jgi:D-sedoheptulose 7-phosphate isomerase